MLTNEFSFELITQDDKARLGKIKTIRGIIDTPAFMPVGTQGTVKGVFTDDILKTNTQIILGNTICVYKTFHTCKNRSSSWRSLCNVKGYYTSNSFIIGST